MKRSRFTEQQILYAQRLVEAGMPAADMCRQLGCSETSFYLWKKRCGKLRLTEIQELRQLPESRLRPWDPSPRTTAGPSYRRRSGGRQSRTCLRSGSVFVKFTATSSRSRLSIATSKSPT
jgi:putative transposase